MTQRPETSQQRQDVFDKRQRIGNDDVIERLLVQLQRFGVLLLKPNRLRHVPLTGDPNHLAAEVDA